MSSSQRYGMYSIIFKRISFGRRERDILKARVVQCKCSINFFEHERSAMEVRSLMYL